MYGYTSICTYELNNVKLSHKRIHMCVCVRLYVCNTYSEPVCYLFQGNVGDSRAIASVAGEVEVLSHDHKPNVHGKQKV